MKKRHPLLYITLFTVLLTVACNLGRGRIVKINNANESLRIEYRGEIFFNTDGTGIDGISPGGFIKYKKNDKELIAKPTDSGTVVYKLYIDNRRFDIKDSVTKDFFKSAMEEIFDHYER